MMMKKILLGVFILFCFGMAHAQGQKIDIPIGDSPALGPKDAPITIIEFIDFQ